MQLQLFFSIKRVARTTKSSRLCNKVCQNCNKVLMISNKLLMIVQQSLDDNVTKSV